MIPPGEIVEFVSEHFSDLPSRFFDESCKYTLAANDDDAHDIMIEDAVEGYRIILVYSAYLLQVLALMA